MKEIINLLRELVQFPGSEESPFFRRALSIKIAKNLVDSSKEINTLEQLGALTDIFDFCKDPSAENMAKLKETILGIDLATAETSDREDRETTIY
jgi:hypothetical protein